MRRLFPVVGFVVMLTVLNASKPHIDTAVVAAVVAAPVLAVGDGECDIFCQEGAPANCEEGDPTRTTCRTGSGTCTMRARGAVRTTTRNAGPTCAKMSTHPSATHSPQRALIWKAFGHRWRERRCAMSGTCWRSTRRTTSSTQRGRPFRY
jgi:hypothetical protein